MIYTYTWNHVLLFAQMCNCEDTKATVTGNWVKMLEYQQEQLFPFTLWPLTYRTSAVIASTSLLSPTVATVKKDNCQVVVKIYRSNDVIIMCFQHVGNHAGSSCPELCKFNSDAIKKGHGIHSSDKRYPLVPCGLMNTYSRIKKKAMIELIKFRSTREQGNDFSCILCTGYEIGGILATFMACDLANEFKSEAEFMGLSQPTITVDCVCFSMPKVANDIYWDEFESVVFVGNKEVPLKTKKKLRMKFDFNFSKKVTSVPCSRYIEDIDQKIKVLT